MNLKDTKIFIPEIPKEWTGRLRSGHTNVWNEGNRNGLPEIKLDPPTRGLYAKRFDDGWYWVCDCPKCLGKDEPYPYIVCDDHDRCDTCNIHRSELNEVPWGTRTGWQCKPCRAKERAVRKAKALAMAREHGHTEDDCYYTHLMLCPVCASECSSDDMEDGEHEVTCGVCDTDFIVEIEYERRYTSKLPEKEKSK